MSCPVCGAPPREGSLRCPQCGWASSEALAAAQDDLPVYGQPSSPSPTAPPPRPARPRRGRRFPAFAVTTLAALVAVAGISIFANGPARHVEDLDARTRLDLPAAIEHAPHVAWRRPVAASAVLGVRGTVAVVDEDGRVAGYDARTGERRWRLAAVPAHREASLSRLTNDRLLVSYEPPGHGRGGLRLVVLDADSGRVRWRYTGRLAEFASRLGDDAISVIEVDVPMRRVSLTVLAAEDGQRRWHVTGYPIGTGDGRVYVVDGERLRAVDLDSGEERWTRDVAGYEPGLGLGTVAVGGTVVLGRSDSVVVGLSAEDGAFLWSHGLDRPALSLRPAGGVVVAAGPGDAVGLDPRSGEERWHVDSSAWRYHLVQIEGRDGVYALGEDVVHLDPDTGRQLASMTSGVTDLFDAEVNLLADGVVYVPENREELQALEPEDLDVRWSVDLRDPFVAITAADDTVLIATDDEVIAYR